MKQLIAAALAKSASRQLNEFRGEIRALEASEEFAQLVQRLSETLRLSEHCTATMTADFLKVSGWYFEAGTYETATLDSVADLLLNELGNKRHRVTFLVSLPWADLKGFDCPIDLGWYKLRRLTSAELSTAINNDVRAVFYWQTALTPDEMQCLAQEAWLEVEGESENASRGFFRVDFSGVGGGLIRSQFPQAVERALTRLMLLEWQPSFGLERDDYWWPGFPVGTLIKLKHSLASAPVKPVIGQFGYEFTDTEEGEWPVELIMRLHCAEPSALSDLEAKLQVFEGNENLKFIPNNVGLFLLKAAIVDWFGPAKIDQFINHVFALEALLGGDQEPGFSKRLYSRLARLLDHTQAEVIMGNMKEIYKTRSKLVHGETLTEIPPERSWLVREYAQKATRRAIERLHNRLSMGEVLGREELRVWLDAETGAHGSTPVVGKRNRMKRPRQKEDRLC